MRNLIISVIALYILLIHCIFAVVEFLSRYGRDGCKVTCPICKKTIRRFTGPNGWPQKVFLTACNKCWSVDICD